MEKWSRLFVQPHKQITVYNSAAYFLSMFWLNVEESASPNVEWDKVSKMFNHNIKSAD